MRSFPLLPGLAVALSLALPARSALAAGRPLLVVHRTEDVSDCPDARTLAGLVAQQMKRPALEPAFDLPPGDDRGLDVQIYRSGQGFTAVIQAAGKTRKLSDKGSTCEGLAGALAISIAVLLDTELPPDPDPSPPSPAPAPALPPGPPPDARGAAAKRASSPPASSSSGEWPQPAPEDPGPPSRKVRVSLSAAPVITVGLLQGFAGGVASDVELRIGRFTVGAGVMVLPGVTYAWSSGQVKLDMTTGMIRACGIVAGDDPMRFVLCVEPMAGALHGSGQGFPVDRTTTLPWGAVSASALFQQKIYGALSWGARASLVVPLVKASFSVDNVGTAFSAAPIGGAWNAELRVSIW